ncbi:NAD(P)H-dependent oxidoreductase [Roseobacter sp. YSTF-M11]|uniref:FMN dependent NADH:quinone oxidoreductase n=1 Tax=Roseobacter insulae TaxID=2859783 RepID=A0A9X1FX56_9RHOB|nr:NAD(P)H-dependent oxidoreductase [Roseobacter insulae]MBW4709278.1 NAD(P)H-dependent oxidoreductase [Roseobacter insulae]
MTQTILHIDASARHTGSTTRSLSAKTVAKLSGDVIYRDLTDALPQINETWVNANFTPAGDRTPAQKKALTLSDDLIGEIMAADVLVIGVPVYNFGVPAALKAWIDLIARAGVTFAYTENGPKGLLTGKRAVIVLATGGTEVGSEIDFASGYLRHIMGFIGITDVEIIAADRTMADAEEALAKANAQIDALAA